MDNGKGIIIALCETSGAWSRPFARAGYRVISVDPQNDNHWEHWPSGGSHEFYFGTVANFIAEWQRGGFEAIDGLPVVGVLANPPCTQFAASGARWWAQKDREQPELLAHGLAVVDQCLQAIEMLQPKWWALENPVGRLRRLRPELGAPALQFDPCQYAGWSKRPETEAYTKRTQLFGTFNPNLPLHAVEPTLGSKMHRLPPSAERANLRSKTPEGFARAFLMANICEAAQWRAA